ncbi:hypothetical protein QEZ54_23300 [Catellatospora sp. KI3]|uniref:hypothetical protein n=1 Tax=Catellatospora sp. KI3 TaxID=3041620 RepID=UPI0024828890|nr:hypothetical protein [Catellatospora sp. KI3]MDI1463916.1 hypothetical protein [Catellatospora sp. KI3]
MTSVPFEVAPLSELLREPTATISRLARARAVRLQRRGEADDLVLMSAKRAEQENEVVDLTAALLSGMVRQPGGSALLRHVLPAALPWIRFLPPPAVDEFAAEFIEVAEAAAAVGNVAPISVLLAQWRHTAEVYADPDLHRILTAPSEGDFGPVPRPEDQ